MKKKRRNASIPKSFLEDLGTISEYMNQEGKVYMMSYCLYAQFMDESGETVNITGFNTGDAPELLGRLEMIKHTVLKEHYEVQSEQFPEISYPEIPDNSKPTESIKEETLDILKKFIINKDDKPN